MGATTAQSLEVLQMPAGSSNKRHGLPNPDDASTDDQVVQPHGTWMPPPRIINGGDYYRSNGRSDFRDYDASAPDKIKNQLQSEFSPSALVISARNDADMMALPPPDANKTQMQSGSNLSALVRSALDVAQTIALPPD